ncbi:ABC transporter ATP-binding protein [Cohnella pontilimi]|uniref:ABC transporter ATP-binding protein n=1 Tax=Cohnella pontilimi TaxID=2564100 RepID=A0A4U0FCP8_9BACL|nr:ABC transporter ATP-binding protein [Cohnella pontilimi]TJY42666.1 ABC transporter ATP-binding protein [Cohnella pontilimi]
MDSLKKSFSFILRNRTGKIWVALTAIAALFEGFVPFILVWITKSIFDLVAKALRTSQSDLYLHAIWMLLLFVLINLLAAAIRFMNEFYTQKTQSRLDHDLEYLLIKKVANDPISNFDIPDYHNHFSRLQGSVGNKIILPVQNIFATLKQTISCVTFICYLTTIHWSLVLLAIVSCIPLIVMQFKLVRVRFFTNLYQTPLFREINYLKYLLTARENVKEIRIFGLANHLLNKWSEKYLNRASEILKVQTKQTMLKLGVEINSALIYLLATSTLLLMTRANFITFSIGDFFAIIQSVQNLQHSFNELNSIFSKIYESNMYVSDFQNFMKNDQEKSTQRDIKTLSQPLTKGIVVDKLSFSYGQGKTPVLENVSFEIKPGEKVAIVGANGSGKTTLIKCLIGLYPVSYGSIYINGIDINEISKADLRKNITVIFQDFIKYHFSIRENIAIGNVDAISNLDEISRVSQLTGIHEYINVLPDQYETKLGNVLTEGIDLSGGQWQKIALSRALFSDGQIIVLDEPTSSMDPLAELDIFNSFEALVSEKTAIFISHRLAVSRIADKILVMKAGRLVEQGTHEELMKKEKEYYSMFMAQAKWYEKDKSGVA